MRRRPSLAEQLAHYIVDDAGCWIWTRALTGKGYGKFQFDKKLIGAHVAAWAVANGRWPTASEIVRHSCDVKACINPAHLLIGTHADNTRDAVERNRIRSGELHGNAKLTVSDVSAIRSRRAAGEIYRVIAADFDVSPSTVHLIATRRTWQRVA